MRVVDPTDPVKVVSEVAPSSSSGGGCVRLLETSRLLVVDSSNSVAGSVLMTTRCGGSPRE